MSDGAGSKTVAPAVRAAGQTQRLDKWLWFTRIVKTRSQASRLVASGKVRVNRVKCDKPSQAVRPEDVITVAIGPAVRVLKVVAAGNRRGPAPEAQMLYEDLARPEPHRRGQKDALDLGIVMSGQRAPGAGRPTKRERRQLDRLRTGEA